MTTKKLFFLFSILFSLIGTGAWAEDLAIQNADGVTIHYNYINDGKELEVTSYYWGYRGSVVIPEEVTYMNRTRKVTSIGVEAFNDCSELTSITIPSSITSIGNYAFNGCYKLTSVHITDIAAWCKIEFDENYTNPLYYAHHLYFGEEEITDLIIPNSVTTIGEYAFYYCSGLTSVTIPNSVKIIGASAFRCCNGLISVTIGNSVTSIGDDAFLGCSGLTSVHLTSIATWCNIAFNNVDSNPLPYAHHLYLGEEEITDLIIPNSVTSIGERAFSNCCSLTSVTIPGNVISIGNIAFNDCDNLISVTIGNGVTSIGEDTFYSCNSLTSVTIGNSVTDIGRGAFNGCSSLTSITIPGSVTSIGPFAFSGCDIPEVISKIEEPFNIDEGTFSNNTYLNATLYVPAGTIDKYKATWSWKKFSFIEEETGGDDTPETKKCEKPTITFKDGKLSFSCATEGVSYQYNITASSVSSGAGNNIDFTPKYTITAYATKDGYEDSDTAILEVSASDTANGDMNGDGVIDAADIVKIVNIIMEQKE